MARAGDPARRDRRGIGAGYNRLNALNRARRLRSLSPQERGEGARPACQNYREGCMKDLIKQYLDDGLSRRQLMTGLGALGMSAAASQSVAQSLAPVMQEAAPAGA